VGDRTRALPVRTVRAVARTNAGPSLRVEIGVHARALDDGGHLDCSHPARQVVYPGETLPGHLHDAGASATCGSHAVRFDVPQRLARRASVRGRGARCLRVTGARVSLLLSPPYCVVTARGTQTASPTARCTTQQEGGIRCQSWFPKIMPKRSRYFVARSLALSRAATWTAASYHKRWPSSASSDFVHRKPSPPRPIRSQHWERWYYAYKSGGLDALRPSPRSDRGRCRDLTLEQRKLLTAIREEHPSASVPVILRTLVAEGRLARDAISASSVRRFYQEQGLDRVSLRNGNGSRGKVRLRWQAERPGALWHADVCYGPALTIDGQSRPVRIHGILDDASRYILGLVAHHTEREIDMLGLMVQALRKHGPPDALYLDNGSTYRGQTLSLACARMGTALIHAKPYDAPARGKMERFWRTLREGCLDFVGSLGSLRDLNVRLWAFIDEPH